MTLERYSHVMHLTSQVSGACAPGKGPIDVLRATLPAGTVSGAPKVRAMEIIDELEPAKRGPYAGAAWPARAGRASRRWPTAPAACCAHPPSSRTAASPTAAAECPGLPTY